MNKQNSLGCCNSPSVILQHGLEIKKDIQSEIYELITILKKREHDLCLEVDQKCLELLQETEEHGMCIAPVWNDPNRGVEYIKKQDLLTSKLMFTGDLKFCERVLKTYGNIQKIDCQKNTTCCPKNNNLLHKDTKFIFKEEKKNPEDNDGKESSVSNDSFEVIEQVDCGFHQMIDEERYIAGERAYEQYLQHFQEKAWPDRLQEKASCTKSFENASSLASKMEIEVMNDTSKPKLTASPEAVLRAKLSNKRPLCSSLASPSYTNRIQRENEWLANTVQENSEMPSDKIRALSSDTLSEISASPASSKSCPVNPAEVAGGDNPTVTIKACFGAYLKQNDLKMWLSPNQSTKKIHSTFYEEWVAKGASRSASEEKGITDDSCTFIMME